MESIIKINQWKGWAAVSIGMDLRHLEELYKEAENLFQKKLSDFEKEFNKKTKNLSDEQKTEYGEHVSDEYWKLNEVFPQIFRSSFTNSCFSRLEYELKEICNNIHQYNRTEQPVKLDSILECKKYLTKNVGISEDVFSKNWNNILVYKKIRNTLTHEDGYIEKKGKELIENFFTRNPSLGKLKDFKIILNSTYCEHVLENINQQLVAIYEYTRLHQIHTNYMHIIQ